MDIDFKGINLVCYFVYVNLNGSAHNFIQYYLVQLEIKCCGGGISSDFKTCFNYLNLAYLE